MIMQIDFNKVNQLLNIFKSENYEIFAVGGCVRDNIMGIKPHDIDFCTNATPDKTIGLLNKANIKYTTVGIEYGTIVAHIDNEEYEITTYRSDGEYTNNRKPDSVKFESNLKNDLSRRDFTINAIAYEPLLGCYIDHYDGMTDIENGVIRCIGDPNKRLQEDALRILRALRFSIKYNFDIEEETSKAIHANKELLNNISKERITQEFEKILTSKKDMHNIFIEYSDVISIIIPEIMPCIGFNQNNKYHKHTVYEHLLYVTDNCKTTDFNIKLAALLHDIGKPDAYSVDEEGHGHFYGHPEVCAKIASEVLKKDFRITTEQYNEILALIQYHDMEVQNTDKSLRKAVVKLGKDTLYKWFTLKQADFDDHLQIQGKTWYVNTEELKNSLDNLLEKENCFKITDLAINGNDIMKITGLKPCKKVGEILRVVFNKVINDEVANEAEALKDLIQTVNL